MFLIEYNRNYRDEDRAMYKPKFSINDVIKVTGGDFIGNIDKNTEFSISTDTRTITKDDAYLALCGQVFDGHNFVQNAFSRDAKIAVIDEKHVGLTKEIKGNFVVVKNTLTAYLELASFHKDRMGVKVIAVTGSSGKTTTKEYLYSVFNSKFKTQKSIKNHNNEIGLCQTLLSVEEGTKYCIVEMGMRGLGEIDLLAKYARPDIALITNAGTAHIGILGSRENIAKAKCEITNYLKPENYLIFHNEMLIKEFATGNFNKISYGIDEVKVIEKSKNICAFEYDNFVFTITDSAEFNILNALAAIKAAKLENYTYDEIQKGLLVFQNVEYRNEITVLKNGTTVISDCYNANPDSASASLKHICEIYKYKKIVVVFGDMFELGEYEEQYHRDVGKLINELNVNYFVSVGKLAKIMSEEVNKLPKKVCENVEEAAEFLLKITDEDTIIFLKASRGMYFEKILEIIKGK